MQPTYLPWCGYFALMDLVDEFLLLDIVAFSKQSYQQRNRIRTTQGLEWLTIPVKTKDHLGQALNQVELSGTHFLKKHLKAIEMNYHKASYFGDHQEALREIYNGQYQTLTEFTTRLILWMREALGIRTPVRIVSSLCHPSEGFCKVAQSDTGESLRRDDKEEGRDDKIDRLIDLCHDREATHYISPQGAKDYLEDSPDAFGKAGIALSYQRYEHPQYQQLYQPFIPFASSLDLLLIKGPEAIKIIREGRKQDDDTSYD